MPTKTVQHLQLWMISTTMMLTDRIAAAMRPQADDDNDRGDVPGWVMITVMTAAVVIALLTVFKTQVTEAVTNAFSAVNGAK